MNSADFIEQAVALAPHLDLREREGRLFLALGMSDLSGKLALEIAAGVEHHGRVMSAASSDHYTAFFERMKASNGRALALLGDLAWFWALLVSALEVDPVLAFGSVNIEKKFRESRIFGASHPMAGKLGHNGVMALSLVGHAMCLLGRLAHQQVDGSLVGGSCHRPASACLGEFSDAWRVLVGGLGGDAILVLSDGLARRRVLLENPTELFTIQAYRPPASSA